MLVPQEVYSWEEELHLIINEIDFITIASAGNASDFGDLQQERIQASATASQTRGVHIGGNLTYHHIISLTCSLLQSHQQVMHQTLGKHIQQEQEDPPLIVTEVSPKYE